MTGSYSFVTGSLTGAPVSRQKGEPGGAVSHPGTAVTSWYLCGVSQLHVRAEQGDVAPIVLLPGDPDRATRVAERFLENSRRYTEYRHLYGYTGTYKGVPVSVQTTGMGCPSLAIVVEELVRLGASTLMRIGTSGVVSRAVTPGDLIVATGSVANEGTSRQYLHGDPYSAVPDFAVTSALSRAAASGGARVHEGLIQTDDAFYAVGPEDVAGLEERGVLSIEMEASALFLLGKLRNVRTGCILVASNRIGDSEFVAPSVLEEAVDRMIESALEASVLLHANDSDGGYEA